MGAARAAKKQMEHDLLGQVLGEFDETISESQTALKASTTAAEAGEAFMTIKTTRTQRADARKDWLKAHASAAQQLKNANATVRYQNAVVERLTAKRNALVDTPAFAELIDNVQVVIV